MSTYVVDRFLVFGYDADGLNDLLGEKFFYSDQAIFLELGGDSNLSRCHPVTNREVRSRKWSALEAGQNWEIMQAVVGQARACEGQTMRWTGERQTLAETYIRRARNALATPVPFARAASMGVAIVAAIECKLTESNRADIEKLSALMPPQDLSLSHVRPKVDGATHVWYMSPVLREREAALFLRFHHLDDRPLYAKVKGCGNEFGQWQTGKLAA